MPPDAASPEQEEREALSQASRAIRITTPLVGEPLLVTGFRGNEGLSEAFRFELSLISDDDSIDFSDLVGGEATVTVEIPNADARHWNGILTSVSQTSKDEQFAHYSAVLEPAVARMRLKTDCRVFQDQKVDDILEALLADFDSDTSYTDGENRLERNYCVQYREADWDFLSRLVEESGLFFYFKHSVTDGEASHTLTLCDDSSQLSEGELPEFKYCAIDAGDGTIKSWVRTQTMVPAGVLCRDTSFQLARTLFDAVDTVESSVTLGDATHKLNPTEIEEILFESPAGYGSRYDVLTQQGEEREAYDLNGNLTDDASRAAKLHRERLALEAITIQGRSDILSVAPGLVFSQKGHYNADDDYLVTQVHHNVELGVGVSSAQVDDTLKYENTFSCQPACLPFRTARRTRKPIVHGVQTAIVVADHTSKEEKPAEIDEQRIDKFGRVKVWFTWDRRPEPPSEEADAEEDASTAGNGEDEAASEETADPSQRSCWIRVAQVWAGKKWGAFFWPRHGQEVIVAFEHGDPDRPIIIGSVYNSQNMPPVDLPLQQYQAGIRSCSVNGNPASDFSALVFCDELDKEHLDLISEKHKVSTSEESCHEFVHGSSVRVFGSLMRLRRRRWSV